MITELINQLENTNLFQRTQIKRQLMSYGEQAVAPLIEAMMQTGRYKNWEAASLLGQLGDERCIAPLLQALVSPNPLVGQVAADVLSKFDLTPWVAELTNALPYSHRTVQLLIVRLLENIGDWQAVPALIELLVETSSPSIRSAVIKSLGRMGDTRAVNIILAFERDTDPEVYMQARIALDRLNRITRQRLS